MSPWNISFRAYLGHLPECTILSSCRMLNCVCTTPASRILFFNYCYYCFFFFLRKSYSRTAEGAAEIWLALSQSHFFQKEGENIFLIIHLQLPFPMYLQKGNGLTVCELLWCIGWRFLYPMFIDLQSILWIPPEWCLITTLCDVSSPDAGIFFLFFFSAFCSLLILDSEVSSSLSVERLVLVPENFWNVLPHGPQELCRALLFFLLTASKWTTSLAFCSSRYGKSQPVPLYMFVCSAVSCMQQILEGCLLLSFSVCSILQYPPVQLESLTRRAFVLLAGLAQVANVTPRSQSESLHMHVYLQSIFHATRWSHWQKVSWITGATGRGSLRLWNQLT